MSTLKEKTILITGGTSGIGFETAKQAIDQGAKVIITGRNEQKLVDAISELGPNAQFKLADASIFGDSLELGNYLEDENVKLDALFLNAGIAKFAPIHDIDEQFFDKQFDINVKGLFFTIKYLLPVLKEGSSVIINASINAHIGMPNSSVYAASKAAVLSLARTLSSELVERGIRVNAISPGPIQTPIYGKLGLEEQQLNAMASHIQEQIPLNRFGNPSEIAKAALFLASNDSSFMLGSEIIIDGGMSTL